MIKSIFERLGGEYEQQGDHLHIQIFLQVAD